MIINKIDNFFYTKLYSKKSNIFINLFSKIGSFISIIIFILILLILPLYHTKKIALISIISLFYSTLIVFILKYLIKRERIYNDNNIKSRFDPYSFPSGHISRLSSFIFPSMYLLPLFISFIIIPIFISMLRIRKGYHYFSDCVVGYIIGLISGIGAIITFKYCIILEKMLSFLY